MSVTPDLAWQATAAASLLLSVPAGLALRRVIEKADDRKARTSPPQPHRPAR